MPTPYRVAFSYPATNWIATDDRYQVKADAAKYIAKKLGYPRRWRQILGLLKTSEDYVGSEKTELRYSIGRWTKKDMED